MAKKKIGVKFMFSYSVVFRGKGKGKGKDKMLKEVHDTITSIEKFLAL